MDWNWTVVLLLALLVLACPIGMTWMMRRKRGAHGQSGMRGREEGVGPLSNSSLDGPPPPLDARPLAIDREIAPAREAPRARGDGKQ